VETPTAIIPRVLTSARCSGLRSLEDAKQRALAKCAVFAPDCALYAVEDELSLPVTSRH
jgi:hypothetical protein